MAQRHESSLLGHEAVRGPGDRTGTAELGDSRRRPRVGGDVEADAAVHELHEEEAFLAGLWVTGQGAVGQAPVPRVIDDVNDATGDPRRIGGRVPTASVRGVLT